MTRRLLRRWDWGLSALLLLAWALGFLFLESSMRPMGGSGSSLFMRQVVAWCLGFGVLILCAFLPPRFLERWAYVFYGIALLLLLAVLLKGEVSHGARRWISIGAVRFQPSEPAKIAMILALASFMSGRKRRWNRVWPWLQTLMIMAPPMLLVLRQPDLGTSSVFGATGVGMLVAAGMPALFVFLLMSPLLTALAAQFWPVGVAWILGSSFVLRRRGVSTAAVAIYLIVQAGVAVSSHEVVSRLEPYQRARLSAFVNPEKDPQGAGYQVRQSKIAIGSGGWSGMGYGHGPLKELHYLPRQHTDFVFSVVGEEGGFLAAGGITILFGLIVLRGFFISRRARHPFVASVAAGASCLFFYHTVVNIGVTVGLLPVTGLPLPFFSHGGSFMLSSMAAAGLLLGAGLRKLEY